MRTPFISLAFLALCSGCTEKAAPVAVAPAPKVTLAVTEKGFEPSEVKLKKGEKTTFVVKRTSDATCATELLVEGTDLNVKLPLNEAVTFEWTPPKSGQIRFGCAMGMMVSGVLMVE